MVFCNRSRLLPFFPSPSMGEDMVGVDFSTDGSPHPNPPPQGGRERERLLFFSALWATEARTNTANTEARRRKK
jgi:hypothetical protein